MTPTSSSPRPLLEELQVAERLAREAGAAAMRLYGKVDATMKKRRPGSAVSPVTAADHEANRVIVRGLKAAFPADAILSEESADPESRLTAERVWIVDPLDGTKEFLARNGEFSVMIGLAIGGRAVLGVVYLPDGEVLFSAAAGMGAWMEAFSERTALRCRAANKTSLRLVVSRSHPDPLVAQLQRALGISRTRPCGSVGVKISLIARGECDLYVHPVPYMKEWDTCAPEVLLREAGGTVTDCLGGALEYNKPDPVQPHGIAAGGPGALDRALAWLRPRLSPDAEAGAGPTRTEGNTGV